MTPEEKEELYNKEVKPFFDDWQEAVQKCQDYLRQFVFSIIDEKPTREEFLSMTQETIEKSEQMRKITEEKEKKHREVFNKFLNKF